MNQVDVDFSILPDVITEVQEHLPELERDLHRLVQTPTSNELLASAFRRMHTIKGDFGYCRATPIMEFVHQLEGVLQSLRDHRFQCSALIAEALVQSMDQVQGMMETLVETRQFDDIAREELILHIQALAQAGNQADADQSARYILMTAHNDKLITLSFPSIAASSAVRAKEMGEQLAKALADRRPGWTLRVNFQRALLTALNAKYLRPCNAAALELALLWHDVGLLALPDAWLGEPPTAKSVDWPVYAAHPERAASWLLTVSPDCLEAAQIIRQHHLWVNGSGILAPDYPLPPHPGALLLASADLLFDRLQGLTGEEYRRGILRALFEVNSGLESRFDAELINAFEVVMHGFSAPAV